MSDEPQAAPGRVAEALPEPANSNAPGAVNVDRDGNAIEAEPAADPAPAAQDAPAARRSRAADPAAPAAETQIQE